MIQEVKMFTIICDNCKIDLCEGEEYSCWNDECATEDIAMESDWIKEGDKHYCNRCWSYGDDDELIINKERTKTDNK